MKLLILIATAAAVFFGRPTECRAWTAQGYSKPSESELKKKLTPLQFAVTQQEKTEPPFDNDFWNNHEAGIYVDVVSGEPLFGSLDKFESGTGWPSFTRPLVAANVTEKSDRALLMKRTEVRSQNAGSHLGHVFDDGPKPTGLRYCINSASLRFIPAAKLTSEGYPEFVGLFAKTSPENAVTGGRTASAIFAGGCFWCMEPPFEKLPGVIATTSG